MIPPRRLFRVHHSHRPLTATVETQQRIDLDLALTGGCSVSLSAEARPNPDQVDLLADAIAQLGLFVPRVRSGAREIGA